MVLRRVEIVATLLLAGCLVAAAAASPNGPVPGPGPETGPTPAANANRMPPPPEGVKVEVRRTTAAFSVLPRVTLVPEPDEVPLDPTSRQAMQERFDRLETWARYRKLPTYDARFFGPARITIPEFGLCAERADQNGVVIYEGMRFLAAADGQYEVSFTVSVPGMPVTLRLQLVITDPQGWPLALTLPPIGIVPRKSFDGNYLGSSYQVRHNGYSPGVAVGFDGLGRCAITRKGTARFGSWPEGINTFAPPASPGGVPVPEAPFADAPGSTMAPP